MRPATAVICYDFEVESGFALQGAMFGHRKVAENDKTPIDNDALKAASEAMHDAMLRRALREMRPTLPRTVESFRRILAD